jgi:uncharacterized protein (TIGR03066 family)
MRNFGVRATVLVLVILLLMALTGCAPSLVGKWSGSQSTNVLGREISMSFVMDFQKDGKLNQTITTPMGNMTAKGTYKAEGEKITYNVDSAQLGNRTVNLPNNLKSKSGTFKIEGDNLTLTEGNGNSVTLQRVKENP